MIGSRCISASRMRMQSKGRVQSTGGEGKKHYPQGPEVLLDAMQSALGCRGDECRCRGPEKRKIGLVGRETRAIGPSKGQVTPDAERQELGYVAETVFPSRRRCRASAGSSHYYDHGDAVGEGKIGQVRRIRTLQHCNGYFNGCNFRLRRPMRGRITICDVRQSCILVHISWRSFFIARVRSIAVLSLSTSTRAIPAYGRS
ncbi:hypothetical protein BV25DRAFT_1587017 [Artomyces pyxidatus]|uniref:Uncharacterized protein n=1 Tax=Artomyces pyxidatus TaxID=48021 RepID=A0ACB8TBA9_9AGAM|nr:hypothetical protein BV25DRAFT_1587017 [Artomyces pyxidatus]